MSRRDSRGVKRTLIAGVLLVAPAVFGQTRQHVQPKRTEVVAKHTAEVNDIAIKEAFDFEPPPGWSVVTPKSGPSYSAKSESDQAEMDAYVEKGALAMTESALAEEAQHRIADWSTEHPTGSCRLVKKELVKIGSGTAMRMVFELRGDTPLQIGTDLSTAKVGGHPLRELRYVVTGAAHHARVSYTAPTGAYPKLEKSFDASLRKTRGLAGGSAATGASTASSGPSLKITPADSH